MDEESREQVTLDKFQLRMKNPIGAYKRDMREPIELGNVSSPQKQQVKEIFQHQRGGWEKRVGRGQEHVRQAYGDVTQQDNPYGIPNTDDLISRVKCDLATNLTKQMQRITQSKNSFYQLLTLRQQQVQPIKRNSDAYSINQVKTREAVFGPQITSSRNTSSPNRLAQFLNKRYDSQQKFLTYEGYTQRKIIDPKKEESKWLSRNNNDYLLLPKIKAALTEINDASNNKILQVPLKTNTERLSNRLYQNLDESITTLNNQLKQERFLAAHDGGGILGIKAKRDTNDSYMLTSRIRNRYHPTNDSLSQI
ncbi:hypothetical protein FGO68_gene2557 [Halteria grandinella]|uniref:Uncharacterized protein n=1 Tax=Halteria grandinella TaxID=5974 RepID=A0A8J8P2X4_HALGN|nr:hypothetical protein FGO68_gene2557 [Halteria grandinella]